MKRIMLLFALLCASLVAQTGQRVAIVNESTEAQRRWVDVAIPFNRDLPALTVLAPMKWTAIKGRHVGRHSTMVHILADMPQGIERVEGAIRPFGWVAPDQPVRQIDELPTLPFVPSAWVRDEPRALIPSLWIDDVQIPFVEVRLLENNSARQVWRHSFTDGELHGDCWVYVYSLQDVVPVHCEVVYDGKDSFTRPTRTIRWQFGEEVHSRFAVAEGFSTAGKAITWDVPKPQNERSAETGDAPALGDSQCVRFRAELHCRPNCDPQDLEACEALYRFADEQEAWLRAAGVGPVSGVCLHDWSGEWLAFGAIPAVPTDGAASADAEHAAFLTKMATPGHMYDRRPYGASFRHADGGSQAVFGASLAGIAVNGDPRQIDRIHYSLADVALRPQHYRESTGRYVRWRDHTDLSTWWRRPHPQTTGDNLGQSSDAWPKYGVSGRSGPDNNHIASWLAAGFALTGDYAYERWLESFAQIDRANAYVRQERMGVDRGMGRMLRSLSNTALLTTGESRQIALESIAAIVRGTERERKDEGPVKALYVYKDFRGIVTPSGERHPCFTPPFQAIGAMGLYAASRVHPDAEVAELARRLAYESAHTIVQHCVYPLPDGTWAFPYQIAYMPGGVPVPPAPLPGQEWLIKGGRPGEGSNWWEWGYGAVLVLDVLHEEDDALRTKIEEIKAQMPQPRNWTVAQWWAVAEGIDR